MDGGQVVEREPVVPDGCVSNVVADAELPPAPIDVDKVPERLKGAAVIQLRRSVELVVRQARRHRQDPVVRPRVEPD